MAEAILLKYPDRIPIIIEGKPDVDRHKYLVPDHLTVGEFLHIIRKRIKLGSHQALFAFVDGVLPPSSMQLRAVYNEYRSPDGFLYLKYSLENTFGCFRAS